VADLPDTLQNLFSEAGLFRFTEPADDVIKSFVGDSGRGHGPWTERAVATIYANAAEFALLPIFAGFWDMPLPPASPVEVTENAAYLALFKGDCSTIIWTHPPDSQATSPLDITVFSGDISKLIRIRTNFLENYNPQSIQASAAALEDSYLVSFSPGANRIAESGVVRLQGLLWHVKLAIAAEVPEREIGRAIAVYREGGESMSATDPA